MRFFFVSKSSKYGTLKNYESKCFTDARHLYEAVDSFSKCIEKGVECGIAFKQFPTEEELVLKF